MAGLILLIAFIAFMAVVVLLSGPMTDWLPVSDGLKILLQLVIIVGIIPLMIIDEIIGKYQFEALCTANGIKAANVSRARGKRVELEIINKQKLQGLMVPGIEEERIYKDVNTGEVLIHHKSYYAYGGWIMRYTPLNMGSKHPMLFSGGCGAESTVVRDIFRANNITIVN